MQFNRIQTELISKYFADLSKILFASTVVGFFVPNSAGPLSVWVLIAGSVAVLATLWVGVYLSK